MSDPLPPPLREALLCSAMDDAPMTQDEFDDLPPILTTEQVARVLTLSPVQVRRLAAAGDLPAKRIGRNWRFGKEALLRFIQESHGDPESEDG